MELDAPTLDSLERDHGDTYYVIDLDAFDANFHEFRDAFRGLYPKTNIAYSYKTNYTPRLCELVQHWGGYAEVVSRMEYELARRIGVAPARIILNGPLKGRDELTVALRAGSVVNVDAHYQLETLKRVAERWPDDQIKVGLRVTFPVPFGEPSRFGFDPDELSGILHQLRTLTGVEVVGLHCHFLTPRRSPADYRFIVDRMLAIAVEHLREGELRFLNLGGGYLSKMADELRAQLGVTIPSYREYAEAIATPVAARFADGRGPELILEPGIALTADIGRFVTRIIEVRGSPWRSMALVSGSIYDLKPTLHSRNLPVQVIPHSRPSKPRVRGKFEVVGSSCMEHDVLFRDLDAAVAVGDHLVFDNVGAYTNVLRPPFIRGCPAILGWSAAGGIEVLKRGEEIDDVFRAYNFSVDNGATRS